MDNEQSQTATASPHKSFSDMTKEQIAIYAKELNEHFRKERVLRGDLNERDAMLEQRAREVNALNNLLQQHLLEWYRVAEEYREVLSTIKQVLGAGMVSEQKSSELDKLIASVVKDTEEADMVSLLG